LIGKEKNIIKVVVVVGLFFFLLWSLFPFYWIVITSLKPDKEMYRYSQTLIPSQIVKTHYLAVFFKSAFFTFLKNSLITATTVTLVSITLGILGAYAISRFKFFGRTLVAKGIILTYLVPAALLFIPLFSVMVNLKVIDTIHSVILAYLTFCIPFATWMLIAYFRTVPKEIEEAARIDGCSRIGSLLRVLLPLSLPGVISVALFSFSLSWSEFLYALVFLTTEPNKTIPPGIVALVMGDVYPWGKLMATSTLACIPPVVIYILAQKYVIKGFALGAVKG
jgi:ABC-type glycerol-3-phosphate transport system permease component